MVKALLTWAFVLILPLGIAHAAPSSGDTAVRICLSRDYPPFAQVDDDGRLSGALVDYWELWAEKVDVEATFSLDAPQACIERVVAGDADIIGGMIFSPERSEQLDFIDPLIALEATVLAHQTVNAQSLVDIDVPVGVVAGNYDHQFLMKNYPDLPLEPFPSYDAMISALRAAEVSAIVIDAPKPLSGTLDFKLPDQIRKLEIIYERRLRPAVKKGNAAKRNLVIQGLNAVSFEEQARLSAKWIDIEEPRSLHLIWWVDTLAGAVLAAIVTVIVLRRRQRKSARKDLTEETLKELLHKGENDTVEFKSSLRWDIREQRANKVLEDVIAKTISAFLNTRGGRLIIGVDDSGSPLGLDGDYQSFSRKKDADGFVLALTALLNKQLGKRFHKYIRLQIARADGHDVCVVTVRPSDSPVFVTKGDKEEFYIRASASSQPLGLRESHEYISSHFG